MRRVIFALIVLIFSTIPVLAQEGRYGSGDLKILIAFEPTRFKKELVRQLIEELDNGSRTINVVNHQKKGLEGVRASDYDVVFISNSGATAKVRPVVTAWVRDNGNPENVIVHTTQRTQWTPDLEVDSVTSASVRKGDEIAELVREFAARIVNRLP